MSESLFSGAPVTAEAASEEESGRDRRVLVLGGALGAVALGAAAFLMLGGSGVDEEPLTSPAASSSTAAPAAEVAEAAAPAAVALPAATEVASGRNPFKALYVAPAQSSASSASSASAGTGATADGLPTASGTTVSLGQAPAEEAVAEYPLTLVAVGEPDPEVRSVTWKVEGADVVVIPGQRFGKHGELVVLAFSENPSAGGLDVVLQVGDSAPVVVAVGETIQVL